MRPQFSATTRYLAFIAAPVMPISYPGPQGHLYVFDMATGKKSRVGPQGPLLSSFAWSPRSDRLAWQVTLLHGGYPQRRPNPKGPLVVGLASAGSPRNVVLVHPPGKNGDIVDPGKSVLIEEDGGFQWSADGTSLLYWRNQSRSSSLSRWRLTKWDISLGSAHVIATISTTLSPDDGTLPLSPVATTANEIAAMIGDSKGLNSITLIRSNPASEITVRLPYRPVMAAFAPGSRELLIVTQGAGRSGLARQAGLVQASRNKYASIGQAISAFWVTP